MAVYAFELLQAGASGRIEILSITADYVLDFAADGANGMVVMLPAIGELIMRMIMPEVYPIHESRIYQGIQGSVYRLDPMLPSG